MSVASLSLPPDDLLTQDEVRAEFQLSRSTLWRYRRDHGLVVYGGRGHRRYRRGDILEVLRRLGQEK